MSLRSISAAMRLTVIVLVLAGCGGDDASNGMTWPTITATVNGNAVVMSDDTSGTERVRAFTVNDGDVVRLEATETGLSWSTSYGGASVSDVIQTDTSWQATLHYSVSTPGDVGGLSESICRPPCAVGSPSVRVDIAVRD